MSTKPDVALARFADTGGADVTAPSSGLRDSGFVEGTPADQSIVNELLKQHYLWNKYLSEGALSGDHSVSGKLTVGDQLVSFADFTFTANSGTQLLTHTAHGLVTGDGPVRVSNSGGGLPSGLAAGTDYYAIRIDADNFQLADSRANALAGVPVPISTNGTGTQTLLHQAGTTRASDIAVSRVVAAGQLTGPLSLGGVIAPAAFSDSARHDDFAPTSGGGLNFTETTLGLATMIALRTIGGNSPSLSGLTGGTPWRLLWIAFFGGNDADTITLKHQDTNSTLGNRFLLPNATDLVIPQYGIVQLMYAVLPGSFPSARHWMVTGKNF